MATTTTARTLTVEKAAIRFAEPFRITGYVFESMPSVVAQISDGGTVGPTDADLDNLIKTVTDAVMQEIARR